MRRIAWSLIATGFLATAFAAEIPHISGGVGVENRDEMRSVAQNYNLHLVFTQNKTGAYLADVAVRISNANGEKFYTQLPMALGFMPSFRRERTT